MNIKKSNLNLHGLSFSGHKRVLDKTGYEKHDFYYLYDVNKYNCEIELFNIKRDKKGNITIADKKPAYSEPLIADSRMSGGKISFDMSERYEIHSDEGFAYRFKLTDRTNPKKVSYGFDNGTLLGKNSPEISDKYNVILNNRAIINKNGIMQLFITDGYYPGIESNNGQPTLNEALRAKALTNNRTHANKFGGKFVGIIYRLDKISEDEGITRIVGTPYTRDRISSHFYWTENAYQVAPDLGTEEDFKALQTELFKKGINWIADAALVNEGFGGIHLSSLLRKGNDSYAKNMFRSEDKISLGILPEKSKYTRMKIINAPISVMPDGTTVSNTNYNPAKPTYVQFYDSRLATEAQKKSDSPFALTTYENKNTDNVYDITHHDDAVYPFPIEVSPQELTRNIKHVLKDKKTIDLGDLETIKSITDFSNFNVETKTSAAGLEVWDGNVDIAKLNFFRCGKDDSRFTKIPEYERQEAIADFDRGTLAVRDYAVNSGKYWTKLTADTQFGYASTLLNKERSGQTLDADGYMSLINELVDTGKLPKLSKTVIDKEVIQNVLDGNYYLRRLKAADEKNPINPEYADDSYSVSDYILKQAFDLPLEVLPVSTNLLGILTSPYIVKRANTEEEIGVSRYDLMKAGNPNLPKKYEKTYTQAEELYQNEIVPIISKIISDVPGIKDGNKISEYGKYVVADIAPDLTKYLLLKALNKNANVSVKNGEFDFSKVDRETITMQSLGIPFTGKTDEEEAQIVLNILKQGISQFSEADIKDLKLQLKDRLTSRSLNDFKVAEMLMDRTESGLGWRIDAAKDVVSIDAVREGIDDITDAWKKVISIWKVFYKYVLKENPHAYATAEITDLADLVKNDDKAFFISDADAERKFIEETGITSVANYNYFFSKLPDLFAPLLLEDFDDPSGWQANQEMNQQLITKLVEGWGDNPGFLFQSPDDGVTNSYTFVGNHDKSRILHLLALDQDLFKTNFGSDKKLEDLSDKEKTQREIAAEVLQADINKLDFQKVNPAAIAMGSRLNDAIDDVIKDEKTKTQCKNAIKDLASGTFKGKNFDAEAFGTRPFEIAIKTIFDQIEYTTGKEVPNRADIEAEMLKNVLEPAFERFYSIYKLLVTLPGSPTDFAGDRVGVSGYESKAKNYHQQNRNMIHWEWLQDDNDNKYKFVKEFYKNMNKIANLRNNPKLSALNDGATIALSTDDVKNGNDKLRVQSFVRYNDNSVVLVFTSSTGSSSKLNEKMDRTKVQYGKEIEGTDKEKSYDGEIDVTSILNWKKPSEPQKDEKGNILPLPRKGLDFGITEGTVFKNARPEDDTEYIVVKDAKTDKYTLKQRDKNGNIIDKPFKMDAADLNTLILYKV